MLEYVGAPSGAIFQISLLGHCPWVRNSGTKVPNWCQRVWSSRHSSRPGVTLPVLSKVETYLLNLSRFAFQSASKAGTVVEKLSLNDAGMPLPYKVLITGTPSAKLVSVPLPQ